MRSRAQRCAGWLAAVAAACGAAACGRTGGPGPQRPNILLVTIDTLRADRVGAGLTPAIDALAASGLRFTGARSAVPLTLPSHATIHTGLLPPQHGVRENGAGALADSHLTVARSLKDSGYRTAAFVGAFVLDRRFGLAQGFDVYDDQIPRDPNATERLEAERPASAVIDRALGWLTRQPQASSRKPEAAGREPQASGPKPQAAPTPPVTNPPNPQSPVSNPPNPQSPTPNPFFVWIHLYDPHAPYAPPPEFAARAKTPYDGEIAYADAQLARLLDAL